MPNWEMETIRKGFADALVELGQETDHVVVLDADLSQSTLTKFFAKEYPDRFYDMGIAEQGMAATAAGLGLMGLRPFVTSYAMFAVGRAWEIVRQQVSYGEAPVVVVGAHGGISVGMDGPTHQCNEDLALMRVLPNMTVIVPCDYWEGYKAIKFLGKDFNKPAYFRMGREKFPLLTKKDDVWECGKARVMSEGTDGTIVACGITVSFALEACEILAKEGIKPRVLNMHTIKPIDKDALRQAISETGALVSAEEHSIIGGLGSAVAEAVIDIELSVPMSQIGLRDRYLESGPAEVLFEKAGVTPATIADSIRKILKRR